MRQLPIKQVIVINKKLEKRVFITIISPLFFISLILCIPDKVMGSEYEGHVTISAGGLSVEKKFSDAFNIDTKKELGLSFDVKKNSWPVSIAFDSSFLFAESTIAENQYNLEVNKKVHFFRSDTCLGVKKIVNTPLGINPFIAGGGYFVRIYGKLSNNREITAATGYWVGAGVYFDFSKNLTCGVLWKKTDADLNIFDVQSNIGGHHFSLITGFHF